jgi:hypothetical protein
VATPSPGGSEASADRSGVAEIRRAFDESKGPAGGLLAEIRKSFDENKGPPDGCSFPEFEAPREVEEEVLFPCCCTGK